MARKFKSMDGNNAAAWVSYAFTEVAGIYPINLYINAGVLIMDEPTAVLTPQESEHLMQFIKNFTAKGNSVVFITHKMKEVMEVADRIVVMRNGVVVDEVRRADTDEQQLEIGRAACRERV